MRPVAAGTRPRERSGVTIGSDRADGGGGSQRLWTGNFVLAIATNLCISMVFYLLMTTMALYAVERFDASESTAGLASSSFLIGALGARVFAGKFLDFVGRRRTLAFSLVVFVFASVAYLPVDDLTVLLLLRLVHGIAFGTGNTAITASVMGLIPADRRGEGIGYFGISTTLATAAGPFLAVLLLQDVGYEALFVFSAACSVAGLGLALVLRLPERTPGPEERARLWRLRLSDMVDPAALPIATLMLVAGFAYSSVLTFLNSYTAAEGFETAAGGFFLVYAVVVLLSRLVMGRIQDFRGDNAVVYPTLVSFALGLFLLGIAPNGILVVVAGAFVGFGFGALMPSAQAIAVTEAPPHRVGTATSTFYLLLDAGTGLGPLLLGVIIPAAGFHGMYFALAGLVLASILLYHRVHGHKRFVRRFPA
jgi:MFS family permease